MIDEEQWSVELTAQTGDEPISDGGPDAATIVATVRRRVSRRRDNNWSIAIAGILIGVSLITWHWNKLDWQMSRTSWSAYASYQRFQEVPR